MHRPWLSLSLLLGSAALGCSSDAPPPPPPPEWTAVGSPGFSAGAVSDLAFAADGATLYVAYVDGASSNRTTVMKSSGGGWETVGTAGFSPGAARSTSLCLHGGVPHVAFVDAASSNKATVMAYTGGAWTTVGAAGFSPDPVSHVAIGSDGAALYVVLAGTSISGMTFAAGSWTALPGLGGGNLVTDMDLPLHVSGGKLYFAWLDYFGGNYHSVVVAAYDVAQGTLGTIGQLDVTQGVPPAIASDGGIVYWTWVYSPYISFQDPRPQVYRLAPGVAAQSIGSSLSDGGTGSVSIDAADGDVFLAYSDASVSGKAVVKKYSSGAWALLGRKGFSADAANFVRVKVVGGTPYVAYQDLGNGGRATVMKYQ